MGSLELLVTNVRTLALRFITCLTLLFVAILPNPLSAAPKGYSGNIDATIAAMGDPEYVSFQVDYIRFQADIPCDQAELLYLTGLSPKEPISKKSIRKAHNALLSKKRFSHITINVESNGSHKILVFDLKAHYIVKKIVCHGIWFGKATYTTLYAQQPGDLYDASLHTESVKTIKQYLHDQGYFTSTVTDTIKKNEKNKTITVHLAINKGKRFFVKNVSLSVTDNDIQKNLKQNNDIEAIQALMVTRLRSELFPTFYTKEYAAKQIKKCKRILVDNGFAWSHIKLSKTLHNKKPFVDLAFIITMGKRKLITTQGNTVFTKEHIDQEIMNAHLPDWVFSSEILSQQLLHEYAKKGYWHARIKPKRLGDVGFHFDITEGDPVTIDTITVTDSLTHTPDTSTPFLKNMLLGKHADQEILDSALEHLKQFYVALGFWDFAVIDQVFTKTDKKGSHSLALSIDKGQQRLWGGLAIEGFKELEKEAFFKKFKKPTNKQIIPFNIAWIQEQRLFLTNYFQKRGNWYATIEPEFIVTKTSQQSDGKPATVTLFVHWKVDLGPQVTFGKAVVRGTTTIPFNKLKQQFVFTSDEPWSREKIDLTRKKLKQLDIFKTVQVQSHQLTKNKGRKPVIITLIDDDPVELRVRAGYFLTSRNFLFKQESTPKIGSSLIIKNPTNRADRILFETDWSFFERTCTIDYRQPSPFGLSGLSNLKGFASKYVHPVEIAHSGSAYEASQIGFLGGLRNEYKRDYHWQCNIGNEWLRTSRVRGNLNFDKNLIDVSLPYLFINPSVTIDKLDSHTNTTSGILSNADVKMMIPENDGQVSAKLKLEQGLFYPVYDKIILAGRVRFGHIFQRRFDRIMPVERFYLGGPYSVRGYEPDALPPLGVSQRIENGQIIKDYTIQGGSSMFNANLELRVPIYKSFGVVLFQDVGALSQTGLLGLTGRWYPGSGFGLRYKTPIGSLRFDIGWKWKRRMEGDVSKYAWYLTLGEAF